VNSHGNAKRTTGQIEDQAERHINVTVSHIEPLVKAANAPLTDPKLNRRVGTGEARFELYHFALSVCSQKVRTCLAEKGASYLSHDINLQAPLLGNYDPAYVRLRLEGNSSLEFATGYTGRSGVASEGFDPAVVPTLVDHKLGRVYVDSAVICRHIDAVTKPFGSLVPQDLEDRVNAEIEIVDGTPHVAVLYGAHPDLDFRPKRLQNGMPGIHNRKLEKIRAARASVPDDPGLTAAFDAKIEKEEAGRGYVASADKMRSSVDEIINIVAALESRLLAGGPWICGDRFSLADVIWAVSLFRLQWLGMAFCWEGNHPLNDTAHPAVLRYGEALFDRQSFRDAVIGWPGIPQTEYVDKYYQS
jgi:2,5-dichlorohydroquinone reductive dechlorinase